MLQAPRCSKPLDLSRKILPNLVEYVLRQRTARWCGLAVAALGLARIELWLAAQRRLGCRCQHLSAPFQKIPVTHGVGIDVPQPRLDNRHVNGVELCVEAEVVEDAPRA